MSMLPVNLTNLGSFQLNRKLRDAYKNGNGKLLVKFDGDNKTYELEIKKGNFGGLGRPKIMSINLAPDTNVQLLSNTNSKSVPLGNFKEIKSGWIRGKDDLQKAIQNSRNQQIQTGFKNLSNLLSNSKETSTEAISRALKDIPKELLLDVLTEGKFEASTLIHKASQSKNGPAFLNAVADEIGKEQLTTLLGMPEGGTNPFHVAVANGHGVEFFETINIIDSDLSINLLKKTNENGETPLHFVGHSREGVDLLKALATDEKTKGELKNLLITPNKSGKTLFHLGVANGNGEEIQKTLIETNTLSLKDLKDILIATDSEDHTPFDLAVYHRRESFLSATIEIYTNIKSPDNNEKEQLQKDIFSAAILACKDNDEVQKDILKKVIHACGENEGLLTDVLDICHQAADNLDILENLLKEDKESSKEYEFLKNTINLHWRNY